MNKRIDLSSRACTATRPAGRPVLMLASLLVAAILGPATYGNAQTSSTCPWMNTALSPNERATLLLNNSTLDQQMRWLAQYPADNPTQTTLVVLPGRVPDATYPPQVPCTPQVSFIDGPWGVDSGTTGVTAFPVPIAQTASWDPMISWLKGKAQGDEAFRTLHNGVLGPGLDIARTPFNGRNSEYMGEDPSLSGTLAQYWIRAMREATPGEPVEAVIKHFVGNDQETDRPYSSSNIDARTLHEINELEFAIANKGKPGGVMTSYNQVNGVWASENPITITQDLYGEIGFQGFTVTDAHGIHSTSPSLNAGLDQEFGAPYYFTPTNLHAALTTGTITTQQIYNAAFRVVRSYIANGLFDNPLPATASANVSTSEHQEIALKMAEEGAVLLKNDNILPITAQGKKIAVIGPTASSVATNGVSAQTVCTASAGLVVSRPTPAAPLDAITTRAAELGDTVIFDNGSDPTAAASTAAAADIAIVFGYNIEGEGSDLPNLNLFGNGDALIEAVAAANPKTIVIVETGSAILMSWID
jgi:beta-glucosidase